MVDIPGKDRIFKAGPVIEIGTSGYRYEVGGAAYYPVAGGAFSSSGVVVTTNVDQAFWLMGAELLVEMPPFIQFGTFLGYLIQTSLAGGASLKPDGNSPFVSDAIQMSNMIAMAGAGLARNTGGEYAGALIDKGIFSPTNDTGKLFRVGEVIQINYTYRGSIVAGNVPAGNTSQAIVRVILYTVPYVEK